MGSCNVCGSTNVDTIRGACGNCIGKRTVKKRHKRTAIKIITIAIICAIVISGLGYLSASGILQSFTQQASKTIPQTTSEIENKIVPQTSQQVTTESPIPSTTSNTISSTNEDTRVPIRVYNNCNSLVRADNMKDITTYCNSVAPSFRFNMPDILQQALQGQELLSVKTTVYQYGTNDFKIGLYDQLGKKITL